MYICSRVNRYIRENIKNSDLKNYVDSAVRGVRILLDHEDDLNAPIRRQVFAGFLMFAGIEALRSYSLASGDAANCADVFSGLSDIRACESAVRQIDPIVRFACDHFVECAKATRRVVG